MRIVCDIDGVIADPSSLAQEHLLKDNKWDWKEYYKHTLEIPPIVPILEVLNALIQEEHNIWFVTGRPISDRKATIEWLSDKFHPYEWPPKLIMRKLGDERPSTILKLEACSEIRPDLIFEDEPKTAKILAKVGYKVLQVHGYRTTEEDGIPKDV